MAKKFDLIIFDLDGTLFDSGEAITNSFRYAIKAENLRDLTNEEIKTLLGPPLETTIRKYYPELEDERVYGMMRTYRKYYKDVELLKSPLFPGMKEVLEKLKNDGFKIALATYKLIDCVLPLFEHYDIKKYFDSLRGSIDGKYYTKNEIIDMAISDCKVTDNKRICMIGDTEHDFKGAIQRDIYFIGMTYGFGYKDMTEEEKNYDKFLGYCDEAIEILKKVEV